jgi:hypothetical protein
MATSGRGSGVVGYNVQVAVDTKHHLIITHEMTNVGSDRAQLAHMANETKAALERTNLDVIAERGYFSSEEILECDEAGITVTLPKPIISNPKHFGKQDLRYVAEHDVYVCPAGEKLAYSFTTEEHGLILRRYLTNVCQSCAVKHRCIARFLSRMSVSDPKRTSNILSSLEYSGLILQRCTACEG